MAMLVQPDEIQAPVQAPVLEFKDHLSLVAFYNKLNAQPTLKYIRQHNLEVANLGLLKELSALLNILEEKLKKVAFEIANFSLEKEKIKKIYPITTLDVTYKQLPTELKKYFGNEDSYKQFQAIHVAMSEKIPGNILKELEAVKTALTLKSKNRNTKK